MTEAKPSDTDTGESAGDDQAVEKLLRIRYRIRFGKTDLLRWISHRDLARLWERLLRRAALKLSMTEGFHPKPRVGFPSALALGVESLDEVVEIDLAEEISPLALLERLQQDQQPGLTIKSVCLLPEGFGKAQLQRSDYTVSLVDGVEREEIEAAIAGLLAKGSVSIERKKKPLTVEVSEQISRLELANDCLLLSLAASDAASLRPGDVLDLLGFGDWVERGTLIRRTHVILKKELDEVDPAMIAVSPDWEAEITAYQTRHEA
ncbi:MAG: TIGR03936 family radical SAM-associated protein [Rubripirellula sp.]